MLKKNKKKKKNVTLASVNLIQVGPVAYNRPHTAVGASSGFVVLALVDGYLAPRARHVGEGDVVGARAHGHPEWTEFGAAHALARDETQRPAHDVGFVVVPADVAHRNQSRGRSHEHGAVVEHAAAVVLLVVYQLHWRRKLTIT